MSPVAVFVRFALLIITTTATAAQVEGQATIKSLMRKSIAKSGKNRIIPDKGPRALMRSKRTAAPVNNGTVTALAAETAPAAEAAAPAAEAAAPAAALAPDPSPAPSDEGDGDEDAAEGGDGILEGRYADEEDDGDEADVEDDGDEADEEDDGDEADEKDMDDDDEDDEKGDEEGAEEGDQSAVPRRQEYVNRSRHEIAQWRKAHRSSLASRLGTVSQLFDETRNERNVKRKERIVKRAGRKEKRKEKNVKRKEIIVKRAGRKDKRKEKNVKRAGRKENRKKRGRKENVNKLKRAERKEKRDTRKEQGPKSRDKRAEERTVKRERPFTPERPADWMKGGWGLGFRARAGESYWTQNFNVSKLVAQLGTMPGLRWIVINLSSGAYGDKWMAPHSVLTKLNPRSTPKTRDLFGEIAKALQKEGIKVIAYVAAQGPAMLRHGPTAAYDYNKATGIAPSVENWKQWVVENYGDASLINLKKAMCENITAEYANRYGALIDGWWFDQGGSGDGPCIHEKLKRANPAAVLSWNGGGNPGITDYTGGHPTPVNRACRRRAPQLQRNCPAGADASKVDCSKYCPASSAKNLRMVTSIEGTPDGYFGKNGKYSLGHMFMPIAKRWNGGPPVWSTEQGAAWMTRVRDAGGAWTWNLPKQGGYRGHQGFSHMSKFFIEEVKKIVACIGKKTCLA